LGYSWDTANALDVFFSTFRKTMPIIKKSVVDWRIALRCASCRAVQYASLTAEPRIQIGVSNDISQ